MQSFGNRNCRHAVTLWIVLATSVLATEPFGNAPLAFEANRGQWSEEASFGTHAQGFAAQFHGLDVVYSLNADGHHARVAARWLGAAKNTLTPADRLPGTANYYLGNDESRWISGLPTYRRLKAAAIYPGIDLVYYGDHQQLEYDLVIAPGADVGRVVLAFDGGSLSLDEQGNLLVATMTGRFVQHKPVAYQMLSNGRAPVPARYVIGKAGRVKLALGKYDRRRELVIDPTVAWYKSMSSGTYAIIQATAVALDSSGNVLLAGTTNAPDFPTSNAYKSTLGSIDNCCPPTDAFLTKYSADGNTVIFSTYFGGSNNDTGTGLAVDSAGNAILVGSTTSADMSTKNAFQPALQGAQNAFVAKFSPTGTLVFATFLGGGQKDQAASVAMDSSANIYVTGSTGSNYFPTKAPYQSALKGITNGFVTKLSADGSTLLYSTYLGGSANDTPAAIRVGPGNTAYVAGTTYSSDFPTVNAFQKTGGGAGGMAFVTCLTSSGASLAYSTYLGGIAKSSGARAIDVDSSGAAYVTGFTNGGFPIKNAVQASLADTAAALGTSDAFLAKLTADGTALLYSTYLGGSGTDQGWAVRVDSSGSAIVGGSAVSLDFPTNAAITPAGTSQDGFITKYNAAGDKMLFSTYVFGPVTALEVAGSDSIYAVGAYPVSNFRSISFVEKLSGPVVSIPVTFTTVPSGLSVAVDGVIVQTPATLQWAPMVNHTLIAYDDQTSPGPSTNHWLSWSNGGSQSQRVTTPATATTFTATMASVPCVYSLLTTSATFAQAGSVVGGLNVNTQAYCPWTAASNASWITLTYVSNRGQGNVNFSVAANPAGGSRTGTIAVAGMVFTVTQSYTTPFVGYVDPCCSGTSGLFNIFSYFVGDADGASDLTVSNMLINSSLDGRQACYLAFDHVANILYLVNDAGTGITGMRFDSKGQGSGVLSNSQCSVDGTKTALSQVYGPIQVRVIIGLTFAPSFSGNKVIYYAARDKEGMNSGWQLREVWNVPAAITYPNVVSAGPFFSYYFYVSSPTVITATYQDVTSNTNLSPSQILINSALDGRNACYVGYDHKNNILYLVKDDGGGLLPGIIPGSTAMQQNSQCIISAGGSRVTPSGQSYTLEVQVWFLPAFQGPKILYAASQTLSGGNTGWQPMSAFTVQ